MPNETNGFDFNFDDAPGGDQTLEEIFQAEGESPTPVTPTTPTDPVTPETTPLLKTSTGTVYNTVDDAVKGIEHKDALIDQLRQQLQQQTNVDPLKKNPGAVDTPVSYTQDPAKYFADVKAAKSEKELLEVQSRFVNEQFAPYAPLIASMAKSQATEQVVSEIPRFREFYNSQDYKDTLDAYPLLKQSIEISEAYPERSGDLPQLYKMAAMASAGRTMPKVVQSGTNPVVQTRPTVTSTVTTPPNQTATKVAKPSMFTSEGRKAIIEQQESSGVDNLRF